jgi:hypothetical protein
MKTEDEFRGKKVWQFPLRRVKWRAAMFLVNGYEWISAHPFTGLSEPPPSFGLRPNPKAYRGKFR